MMLIIADAQIRTSLITEPHIFHLINIDITQLIVIAVAIDSTLNCQYTRTCYYLSNKSITRGRLIDHERYVFCIIAIACVLSFNF
jgi:hypothetical protein